MRLVDHVDGEPRAVRDVGVARRRGQRDRHRAGRRHRVRATVTGAEGYEQARQQQTDATLPPEMSQRCLRRGALLRDARDWHGRILAGRGAIFNRLCRWPAIWDVRGPHCPSGLFVLEDR
ncbi:hypothetical protein GCM10009682_43490 [Luedemannella flava]|uniref:Transposase n=1 Tax=Luedemannella flava TaxID=349316 RepID=A0ABN2MB50_9ACTN